eukprot:gene31547-6733_t
MWTKEELIEHPEDRSLASYQIASNGMLILMEADYLDIPEVSNSTSMQIRHNSSALAVPSPAGTKERFTLSEMYALVDGMEVHGLKWAKIHKDNKELENKTQGDLKDKWRNWQRNVANGWATARVYMPDDLKQRTEKLVATLPQQQGNSGGRHIRGSSSNHDQMPQHEDLSMNHQAAMGMDHHQLVLMQHQHQQQQQLQYEAAVAAMQGGMGIPGMGDGSGLDASQLAAMAQGDPAMAEAMAQFEKTDETASAAIIDNLQCYKCTTGPATEHLLLQLYMSYLAGTTGTDAVLLLVQLYMSYLAGTTGTDAVLLLVQLYMP